MNRKVFALSLAFVISLTFARDASAFWFKLPKSPQIYHTLGNPSESFLNPESIKLVVWNIYKGKKGSFEPDFKKMVNGKDIVLLQEAYLDDKMTRVFNTDDFHEYKFASSFIYRKKKISTGVANASTAVAVNAYRQRSKYKEIIGWTPKVVMFTEYELEGRNETVLAANIHGLNSVPKYWLAHQLRAVAKKLKAHNGPAIFGGDFNTNTKGKTRYLRKLMKRVGMEEVTFKDDHRMRSALSGGVIDFIFLKGFKWSNSVVHGNVAGSDHKAMEVLLEVK